MPNLPENAITLKPHTEPDRAEPLPKWLLHEKEPFALQSNAVACYGVTITTVEKINREKKLHGGQALPLCFDLVEGAKMDPNVRQLQDQTRSYHAQNKSALAGKETPRVRTPKTILSKYAKDH